MEIALYMCQPTGNVNLRAYVAGRKRARNSSVRAEGCWHVLQLCDPLENVILQKSSVAIFSSLRRVTKLYIYLCQFYSRSVQILNERIKITLSFIFVFLSDCFAILP